MLFDILERHSGTLFTSETSIYEGFKLSYCRVVLNRYSIDSYWLDPWFATGWTE